MAEEALTRIDTELGAAAMADCSEASGSRSAMAEGDRAPGLLPPRKRLLAGLKLQPSPSPASPSPSPSPSPAPAAPAPLLPACSSCGLALPPPLLHRLSSSFLCSPCVLSSHKHMYCSLCLQLLSSHCAPLHRSDLPLSFCADCSSLGSACVSPSTSGRGGEDLSYTAAVAEHPSPGKKPRSNLPVGGGSKCPGCDLFQQTPVEELPSIYRNAVAAAKVVAAIAEKAASDAKIKAMATAAAAARAAARAKVALDNAYRAGQEEATAMQEEGERSSNSGANPLTIKPAMNEESTRHKSVPRNSRSSKRRTLSAIVASEASRMLANLVPHHGNSPLPAVKQQSKRHRSSNAIVRPDSLLAADAASKRSASPTENPSSSCHAKQQFAEPVNAVFCETAVISSSAVLLGRALAASTTTPSSSPLGDPHNSPSLAKLGDLSSNMQERGSEVSSSKASCPVTRDAESLTPAPQPRSKMSPSVESSLRRVEVAPVTPSVVPRAAKAQDLNLAAKVMAGISEIEPSCSTFPKSTPSTGNMRTPSVQNTDSLSCLETSPVTLDNGGTIRRGNLITSNAAPDVLKFSGRPLLQSRSALHGHLSSSSTEHGKSQAECSCSRSSQSPCADPGLLEIVLPVVDAVERETVQPGVEKDGACYNTKEGAFTGGLVLCSNDRNLARDSYGGKARPVTVRPHTSPRSKVREGITFGGTKNQMENLPRLQFGKSSCPSEEQPEISTRVTSACSVPMATAALTRVPTGGCSS